MRRRDFLAGLGGAAALGASPAGLRAQQASMPVIGFLNSATPATYRTALVRFREALQETGFIEGQSVKVEERWADNHYERLPQLAAELVRLGVSVLVANGPAVLPTKAATSTIPIVFTAGLDPIELGIVQSLSRPGGNVTGVSVLNVELVPKRFELLREVIPTISKVGLMINPANPNAASIQQASQRAANALGLQLHIIRVAGEKDLEPAFETAAQLRVQAVVIGTDPFFTSQSSRLAALSGRHSLPAIYQYRDFPAAGGLMSYSGDLDVAYRRAGTYVGRILKGATPGNLPVEQVTKLELIVNLKAAKALGVTIPPAVLARADEVIE